MRRSTWFPLSSLLILLIGGTVCFVGNCNSSKRNLTFVSGILFVLAGKLSNSSSLLHNVGNKTTPERYFLLKKVKF